MTPKFAIVAIPGPDGYVHVPREVSTHWMAPDRNLPGMRRLEGAGFTDGGATLSLRCAIGGTGDRLMGSY